MIREIKESRGSEKGEREFDGLIEEDENRGKKMAQGSREVQSEKDLKRQVI